MWNHFLMMREGEEMAKMLMSLASRALVVAVMCFVGLGAAGSVVSAQSKPSSQPSAPAKKKKKLPPGAKGFEKFADRDASDKLVTGGATRSGCITYEDLIACGTDQFGQGNAKVAIDLFTRASALKPAVFRPHYHIGQVYESQGKYKEAAAAYKRAIALKVDEENGEKPEEILFAHYNLGNVYALTNDHPQAISTYREVIRRLPTAHTPHYNVGLSLAALGKHQEAVNAFKEATKIKTDYAEAYYNMGVAHSKLEEWPQAVEAFKKTLELNPDYAQAHYNLGVAYYFLDDSKALAGEVEALQKTKPELAKELSKLRGK
jgi:tetratricopeptide (TPR) repeat protein